MHLNVKLVHFRLTKKCDVLLKAREGTGPYEIIEFNRIETGSGLKQQSPPTMLHRHINILHSYFIVYERKPLVALVSIEFVRIYYVYIYIL